MLTRWYLCDDMDDGHGDVIREERPNFRDRISQDRGDILEIGERAAYSTLNHIDIITISRERIIKLKDEFSDVFGPARGSEQGLAYLPECQGRSIYGIQGV